MENYRPAGPEILDTLNKAVEDELITQQEADDWYAAYLGRFYGDRVGEAPIPDENSTSDSSVEI